MKTKRQKKAQTEQTQPQPVLRLVSRNEVAEMASLSVETIKRWQAKGLLSPIKLSRRCVRYDAAQVQDLIRRSTVEPVATIPVAAAA